jgi:hypothetical protein
VAPVSSSRRISKTPVGSRLFRGRRTLGFRPPSTKDLTKREFWLARGHRDHGRHAVKHVVAKDEVVKQGGGRCHLVVDVAIAPIGHEPALRSLCQHVVREIGPDPD